MSLYQKILSAQKAIGFVSKNGKNTFHKYDYATESDILDSVKKAANEAGLVILTSADSEHGQFEAFNGRGEKSLVRWAKVRLNYKIVDAETGEKEEGSFDGYSEDNGDKAIYKATTGANKYFLMKFFGVATGDDPEKDSALPPPPTPQQQRPVRPATPIQPRQAAPTASDPEETKKLAAIDQITNLAGKLGLAKETVLNIAGLRTLKGASLATLQDLLDKLQIIERERLEGQPLAGVANTIEEVLERDLVQGHFK